MTWMDVLISAVDTLFELVIVLVIPYLFSLLKKKIEADDKLADNDKVEKYMVRAEEYIISAVSMVNQTFVGSLKAEGKFDAAAQKQAFMLAKDNWLKMMSEEMKEVVLEEIGDIDAWIANKIEAAVVAMKN